MLVNLSKNEFGTFVGVPHYECRSVSSSELLAIIGDIKKVISTNVISDYVVNKMNSFTQLHRVFDDMENSKCEFFLTGSRFFNPENLLSVSVESDFDFFVKEDINSSEFCNKLIFDYGFTKSTIYKGGVSYTLQHNTIPIHIQMIEKDQFSQKQKVQLDILSMGPVFCKLPKVMRKLIWRSLMGDHIDWNQF